MAHKVQHLPPSDTSLCEHDHPGETHQLLSSCTSGVSTLHSPPLPLQLPSIFAYTFCLNSQGTLPGKGHYKRWPASAESKFPNELSCTSFSFNAHLDTGAEQLGSTGERHRAGGRGRCSSSGRHGSSCSACRVGSALCGGRTPASSCFRAALCGPLAPATAPRHSSCPPSFPAPPACTPSMACHSCISPSCMSALMKGHGWAQHSAPPAGRQDISNTVSVWCHKHNT